MSYCRFSSDNWRSDVYCYDDVGGWYQTYVATNRVVGEIPEEPSYALLASDPKDFARRHKAVMDFIETAPREPIGLPHDGASFRDFTLEDFLARVTMLKEAGYNVPSHVFDEIREEMSAGTPEKEQAE